MDENTIRLSQLLAKIGVTAKDVLQGASNSAAATVSFPVDSIAWGLRKVGVPVPENHFAGSNWMREKGLTVEPTNRTAGLLGETVGGLLPIVAAAKAPQIAGGLLKIGENAMAPRNLNTPAFGGQRGVIDFPPWLSRPERAAITKKYAEDFAEQLKARGLAATVEHSGSKAGASSYIKVWNPVSGTKLSDPFRISDHSKGGFQHQFVNEMHGDTIKGLNIKEYEPVLAKLSETTPQQRAAYEAALKKQAELMNFLNSPIEKSASAARPMVFKANQEARNLGVPFSKAFTNSGKYIKSGVM